MDHNFNRKTVTPQEKYHAIPTQNANTTQSWREKLSKFTNQPYYSVQFFTQKTELFKITYLIHSERLKHKQFKMYDLFVILKGQQYESIVYHVLYTNKSVCKTS